jgi:hypothetical protein
MSNAKKKPPFLIAIETPEQAALLAELMQKCSAPASVAHTLAALYAKVERCTAHFAPDAKKDGP